MNILTIIYILGAAAVGFLFGVIVELCIDSKTIMELQENNRKLKLENMQLKDREPVKIVNIIDDTVAKDVNFGGF
jgi:hypothetical protein